MKPDRKKRLIALILCTVFIATTILTNDLWASAFDSDGKESVPTTEQFAEEETEIETKVGMVETQESETESVVETSIEAQRVILKQVVDNVAIIVSGDETAFPSGTELIVNKVEETGNIEKLLQNEAAKENLTVKNVTAFEINLIANGTPVEPSGNVSVAMQGIKKQGSNLAVYHVDEAKDIATTIETKVEGEEVSFTTNHLSVYAVANVEAATRGFVTPTNNIRYMNVNLYDYNRTGNNSINNATKDSISGNNKTNGIYFSGVDGRNSNHPLNQYRNYDRNNKKIPYGVYHGIAKDTLDGTNIQFNYAQGGIFDNTTAAKTIYKSVAFPFNYNAANGWYEFDSNKNYVKFNTSNNSMTMYDYNRNETKGFYPFSNGTNNAKDYSFGMNMEVTFLVPDDKTVNGKDMVFEFSGDDDVWVFVDDKLVLDLGGIHDAVTGSINFKTGLITHDNVYYRCDDYLTGNGTALQDPNRPSNNSYQKVYWNLYNEQNNTTGQSVSKHIGLNLEPGTYHTLRVYYLERGEGESNCKIGFNLLQQTTLEVSKQVENSKVGMENNEYKFQLLTAISNNNVTPAANRTYTLGNKTLTTDNEGFFTLKDGQSALFGMTANEYYQVKEVDVPVSMTTEWSIDNKNHQNGTDTGVQQAVNNDYTQGKNYKAAFTNTVIDRNLIIEKVVENTKYPDDNFNFIIMQGDTPYSGNVTIGGLTETVTDGKITLKAGQSASINNLVQGQTYTVKEIFSNNKYILEKIKVDGIEQELNSENSTTVTIGEENRVTFVNRLITDYLEQNKTAHVIDWDNRKYEINLTASSLIQNITTTTEVPEVDIILVLDKSGSMEYTARLGMFKDVKDQLNKERSYKWNKKTISYENDSWGYSQNGAWVVVPTNNTNVVTTTRINSLKDAAKQFIDNTSTASPNSRIGLVTFNNKYNMSNIISSLVDVSDEKDALKSKIESISCDGGTRPDYGLNLANTMLPSDDERPKYVILFSDGKPDDYSSEGSTEELKIKAELEADALKNKGVTIYTIGLGLEDTWQSTDIASPGCGYDTADVSKLADIFDEISNSITSTKDITGATIKDVIDPRFVICDDEGNPITNERIKEAGDKGIPLANGGVVKLDQNGNQYIEWVNQTIKYPEEDSNGWSKTIVVQAKENFLGGNDVSTNVSPDSNITVGDTSVAFPQPHVNVKVDFNVTNIANVIFRGESVPNTLDGTDIKDLMFTQNNWIIKEGDTITTEWSVSDITAETPKEKTSYTLTVTYTPGPRDDSVQNEADLNTTVDGEVKTAETTQKNGNYAVDVVYGQLNITKKIDQYYSKLTKPNHNQSFVFKIKRYDTEDSTQPTDTFYEVISFSEKDATKALEKTKVINGLQTGWYTVEEETEWSWKYNHKTTGDNYSNDTYASNTSKRIHIGRRSSENSLENSFFGTSNDFKNYSNVSPFENFTNAYLPNPGVVTFVNEQNSLIKFLGDVAAAVNRFIKNSGAQE